MIDFTWANIPILLCGIVLAILWTVARHRRKAVDRLVSRLHRARKPDDCLVARKIIDDVEAAGWLPGWSLIDGPDKQDAAGRVIARSVKRMMKD